MRNAAKGVNFSAEREGFAANGDHASTSGLGLSLEFYRM